MAPRRHIQPVALLAIGLAAAALLLLPLRFQSVDLPDRYSDAEFWSMVTEFSEAGGYFRSDNFVSNETNFQQVVPELRRRTKPGGAYLGVGPDQNFTYVVAIQPRVAFILDIRRQNVMQHLMYKALFELSEDRAEFLSNLFSRLLPDDVSAGASTEQLFDALADSPSSREKYLQTQDAILEQLTDDRFPLSDEDRLSIQYVYRAFYTAGPEIRYSFPNQNGWRRFPTYSDLMLATDLEGLNRSYVASEENYRELKALQEQNRIVPLVGDFAGDHTLRRVGEYLEDHGAAVAAFYVSNVEFYLFQSDAWRAFFRNVDALPLDASSTFIRSDFGNFRNMFPMMGRQSALQSRSLLDNMPDLVEAFQAGSIRTYDDVVWRSYEP